MKIKLTRRERLSFWFPILLPALIGLMYGFAELVAGLGASGFALFHTGMEELPGLLRIDVINFWESSNKGVVTSMISIDLWALSVIFTSKDRATRLAYFFAVTGILVHFFLVLCVAGVNPLIGAINTMSQDNVDTGSYGIYLRSIASGFALLSVLVGWWVRRGTWLYHEKVQDSS